MNPIEIPSSELTPNRIVTELDKYIIGQNEAKKTVAIALRNRWRRMNAPDEMKNEIVPNNILMIGSTGVGKTEIARRLAHLADAPFVKVEASKYTEVGYVGRDVESMVRDLAEQSVNMVKKSQKEKVKEKANQNVEEIILDALIPPFRHDPKQIQEPDEEEKNEKTRNFFRLKIQNKEIEDKKIEIDVEHHPTSHVGIIGGPMGGMDESMMNNIQDMISGMIPPKNKKKKVSIEEARKLLFDEEVNKLIDMDEVKEEAINKAQNLGIIFIDEIDKIAKSSKNGQGGDVSREGVQRDLLPVVEGCAVNTKYGIINTDHILFIAAGAFHFSKPSDLIPELQGRFPIRVELEKLTKNDFYRILTEPQNSLVRQYEALLLSENVHLTIDLDALDEVASIAFEINNEVENIGARRLQTIMSHLLQDFLFDVPEKIKPNENIQINKEFVQTKLNHLLKNRDLSRYIL